MMPVPGAVSAQEGLTRDFYITKALVEKYGYTDGCKASMDKFLIGKLEIGAYEDMPRKVRDRDGED